MSEAARLVWYGDKVLSSVESKVKAALTQGCQIVETDAKYRVPVITGNLQGSINYVVTEDEGRIGTNVEYARRIEYGFKDTDKLGRKYNQPAKPYLTPALDNNRAEILRRMGEILGKAAEDGGNK
jgi:phage gpG-like protein